MKQIINN